MAKPAKFHKERDVAITVVSMCMVLPLHAEVIPWYWEYTYWRASSTRTTIVTTSTLQARRRERQGLQSHLCSVVAPEVDPVT